MADKIPGFNAGEDIFKNASTAAAELTSDVIAGEPLKITGARTDGSLKLGAITAVTDIVRALAMRAGKTGDLALVAVNIWTKLELGAEVADGDNIEFALDGDVITAAGVNPVKGFAVQGGAAGDTVVIHFIGDAV